MIAEAATAVAEMIEAVRLVITAKEVAAAKEMMVAGKAVAAAKGQQQRRWRRKY